MSEEEGTELITVWRVKWRTTSTPIIDLGEHLGKGISWDVFLISVAGTCMCGMLRLGLSLSP